MNRDDIIRMAREHHMQALPLDCYAGHIVNLESLVKAAFDAGAAAEREGMAINSIHTCHAECQRPICVLVREAVAAEREKVAQWMIQRSYATGHGDTLEDLLQELDWQIAENWTRAMVKGVETEREECAKVAAWVLKMPENDVSAAIRARGSNV